MSEDERDDQGDMTTAAPRCQHGVNILVCPLGCGDDDDRDELAYLVKEMRHHLECTTRLTISTLREDALVATLATMADILERLANKQINNTANL